MCMALKEAKEPIMKEMKNVSVRVVEGKRSNCMGDSNGNVSGSCCFTNNFELERSEKQRKQLHER